MCHQLAGYRSHCENRDYWARFVSPNRNVKVYIGAPGASLAAGSGYVSIAALSSAATQMRRSFPSFGGVMLWDASQAYGAFIMSAPLWTERTDPFQPTDDTIVP